MFKQLDGLSNGAQLEGSVLAWARQVFRGVTPLRPSFPIFMGQKIVHSSPFQLTFWLRSIWRQLTSTRSLLTQPHMCSTPQTAHYPMVHHECWHQCWAVLHHSYTSYVATKIMRTWPSPDISASRVCRWSLLPCLVQFTVTRQFTIYHTDFIFLLTKRYVKG